MLVKFNFDENPVKVSERAGLIESTDFIMKITLN